MSISSEPRLLRPKSVLILCLFVLPCLLSGCGGSSHSTTVSAVNVTPTSSSIAVNRQQAFTATATDSGGNSITGQVFTWASSNTSIVTISGSGVATGVAPGTAQITASTAGVTSSAVTLTVTPVIASVGVSPTTASIKVGAQQQFTATATDISGNPVTGAVFTWQNSSSAIATINSTGLVTGVSPGTVMITATTGGITSPVATLTVTP